MFSLNLSSILSYHIFVTSIEKMTVVFRLGVVSYVFFGTGLCGTGKRRVQGIIVVRRAVGGEDCGLLQQAVLRKVKLSFLSRCLPHLCAVFGFSVSTQT